MLSLIQDKLPLSLQHKWLEVETFAILRKFINDLAF